MQHTIEKINDKQMLVRFENKDACGAGCRLLNGFKLQYFSMTEVIVVFDYLKYTEAEVATRIKDLLRSKYVYTYVAVVTPNSSEDAVITFPDFPEIVLTYYDLDNIINKCYFLLEEAIIYRLARGVPTPKPTKLDSITRAVRWEQSCYVITVNV